MAVAVYLPWYSVALTPSGAESAQRIGNQVAAQYGNATLQSLMAGVSSDIGKLGGVELGSVTAHQVLSVVSVVLVVIAALALLDALVPLARGGAPQADGAGAALALLGGVAGVLIIFRVLVPPAPAGGDVALSPREGAWLALLGAATILLAGLWPLFARSRRTQDPLAPDPFSALSGWTPRA